jgi:hypothetical protein
MDNQSGNYNPSAAPATGEELKLILLEALVEAGVYPYVDAHPDEVGHVTSLLVNHISCNFMHGLTAKESALTNISHYMRILCVCLDRLTSIDYPVE